jgi:hypothetical protein
MKECPKCRQIFANGNLRFCRYDGTPLVDKSVPADEVLTMRLLKGKAKRPRKGN